MRACYVPKCPTPRSHRSLHYLPVNEIFKNKWINALKLDKNKISKEFRVCSSHFTENDFLPTLSDKAILKRGAVPSKNLPKSSVVSKLPSTRKAPKQRLTIFVGDDILNQDKTNELGNLSPMNDEEATNEIPDEKATNTTRDEVEDLLLNMEMVTDPEEELACDENANFLEMEKNTLKSYADKIIQANTLDDLKFSDPGFMGMLRTDGDLKSFTGLKDFDTLDRIIMCMKSVKSMQPELEKLQIPLDVAVVLVFTRIKTNLTFKQCGVLFKLHPQTISKIFSTILPLLRAVLSIAVFWPTKDLNSRNIPLCFKSDFVHCRAVCDCTEVEIQKLKSITSRIKSYSHYKGKHTLKFQITINPFGLITHASSTYGEKASDKFIFLNEKILERCEEGDAIMVDKGYAIADEVSAKGVELIRPPILDSPQLSQEESILNTSIARARVHVERSIQRVKSFKIFQDKIPFHMLRHIDDIVVLVCAIVNLSSPILAESRF